MKRAIPGVAVLAAAGFLFYLWVHPAPSVVGLWKATNLESGDWYLEFHQDGTVSGWRQSRTSVDGYATHGTLNQARFKMTGRDTIKIKSLLGWSLVFHYEEIQLKRTSKDEIRAVRTDHDDKFAYLVFRRVDPAEESARQAAEAAKAAFLKQVELALPQIDALLDRPPRERALNAKNKREEFRRLFEQSRSAGPESWETQKDGLQKAFEELKKAVGLDGVKQAGGPG
jgi:hypothetical protein